MSKYNMHIIFNNKYRILVNLFIVSIFIVVYMFIFTNILEIFNPVIINDDQTNLTPQLQRVLAELEEKFK